MAAILAAWLGAQVSLPQWLTEHVHPGACVAHLGMPRSGKSRGLKESAKRGAIGRRVVIFEPYAKRDLLLHSQGKSAGEPWGGVYCSTDDLLRYPEELIDFERFQVVVCPSSLDEKTLAEEFHATMQACWATGEIALVGEEAALYGRRAHEAILRISSGGGHAAMTLHLVSQSLGRLPIDGRRHISHVVAYAQGETSDLEDLRARCGRAFAARVQRLSPRRPPELWKLGDAMQEQPQC